MIAVMTVIKFSSQCLQGIKDVVLMYKYSLWQCFDMSVILFSLHLVIFPDVIRCLPLTIPLIKDFFFSFIVVPIAHLLTHLQDMDIIWYVGEKEETMTF